MNGTIARFAIGAAVHLNAAVDANAEIEVYLKYQTSAGNAPSSWILSAILKIRGHA